MANARTGIEICDKKLEELRPVAYAQQRKHLTERLKHHCEQENEKAQRNIEQMMNREENYRIWSRLRCATRAPQSQAASRVTVQNKHGQQVFVSGKAPPNNAVANSLDERYRAACHAPIRSGQLFHDLGHLADTACAEALLRGDYTFPEECDQATEAILQEIALVFSKQQSTMNIRIEPNDFHWWHTSREKTESSRSLICFSHCEAQSHSKTLTARQVKKINLTLRIGLPLE